MFALSTGYDNLEGGDMTAISSGPSPQHPYLERSKSERTYTQLQLNSLDGGTAITLKNSIGYFSLNNSLESLRFSGTQWTSYTELTRQSRAGGHTITGGLSFTSDRFAENPSSSGLDRSYARWTTGAFGQDDWRVANPLTVEPGLRIDKPSGYGVEILPRIGAIYRVSNDFGLRASAGMGYKVPTIFSDQSDPYAIYQILPISRGAETDVKLSYADLQAYTGYTYTDAADNFPGSQGELFLAPRNRFITDIAYDMENFGEAGIELRYTGPQLLRDGARSPAYWIMDLLLEKTVHDFTFFVAAEKFFHYKQANYSPICSGAVNNPRFSDIWAPLEGRVINAGVRVEMR